MKYFKKHYKPIDKSKIIKQIFSDDDKIRVIDVIDETDTHYICYNQWYGIEYSINKKSKNTYTDRDELKYLRWARRVNEKQPKDRQKLLSNTVMVEYKKRYIEEYPEKLI